MHSSLLFRAAAVLAFALAPVSLAAEKFYTYIGDLGPAHALVAWGTTSGQNSIGRTSKPHGKATVRLGGQELVVSDRNWCIVRGLQPDTEYEYEVLLNGSKIGGARIRTWADKAEKLRFFVLGDYGTGDSNQQRVAAAMWKEFQRLWGDNPVRFVLTTGDNIYGRFGFALRFRDTGEKDTDWDLKFFSPYQNLLARVPLFATLGNHDGNETESRGDLAAYLDNLFFPGLTEGARYYRFNYGGFADFFGLDSTTNSEQGPPRPAYLENSDQHKWLAQNLNDSKTTWKIPYMHHPPFNAGPRHPSAKNDLKHFMDLFRKNGVKVVFSGHEHNFQYSEVSGETGGIRYVISGAGGELRDGDVRGAMSANNIEGWAAQLHFLSVELEGKEMRITPVSFEPMNIFLRNGGKASPPLIVRAP